MDTPLLRAQYYHDQAEKMRKLAAVEERAESRNALLDLANGYDSLCEKFLQAGQEAMRRTGYTPNCTSAQPAGANDNAAE